MNYKNYFKKELISLIENDFTRGTSGRAIPKAMSGEEASEMGLKTSGKRARRRASLSPEGQSAFDTVRGRFSKDPLSAADRSMQSSAALRASNVPVGIKNYPTDRNMDREMLGDALSAYKDATIDNMSSTQYALHRRKFR